MNPSKTLDSIFGTSSDLTSQFDAIMGKPAPSGPLAPKPIVPTTSGNVIPTMTVQQKPSVSGFDRFKGAVSKTADETAASLQNNAQDVMKQIPRVFGFGKTYNTSEELARGIAEQTVAGVHIAGDVAQQTLQPILSFFKNMIPESIRGNASEAVNFVANKITEDPNTLKALDFINNSWDSLSPDTRQLLAKDIPSIYGLYKVAQSPGAQTDLTLTGPNTATSASLSATGKALASDVATVAKETGKIFSDAGSALKDTFLPTPTIDKLVGQVAQGKAKDIPRFTRGLEQVDTTGVKTYADLNKKASETIGELARKQDDLLDSDPTTYKFEDFDQTVGSGKGALKVNYVEKGIDELKSYYAKIGDTEKLAQLNNYSEKLANGQITLRDVNDIARLHGQDLNAFNANGELASGLTKQAAENTRSGLKDSIKTNLDPELSTQFSANDANISDIYTVKELSKKMAEKVNTLTQRLQKPNVLQRIGGTAGSLGRSTGIGDFFQKLLGIEKTPGASTLSPVEIEARLAKNLSRIDAALGKSDAGFISDMKQMISEIPNKEGGFINPGRILEDVTGGTAGAEFDVDAIEKGAAEAARQPIHTEGGMVVMGKPNAASPITNITNKAAFYANEAMAANPPSGFLSRFITDLGADLDLTTRGLGDKFAQLVQPLTAQTPSPDVIQQITDVALELIKKSKT